MNLPIANGPLWPWQEKDLEQDAALQDNGLNVKQYGAKGDGINDDTDSIQNAINDAAAKGLKLFIPSGTYLISKSLNLPNGIHIEGTGWKTSIIKTNSPIKMLNATSIISSYFVYLKGFQLNGNNVATGGIYFQQVQSDSQILEVFVQNINGIGINYDGWCWTGSIKQSFAWYCTTGIHLGPGSNDITIDDCNLYFCNIGIDIEAGTSLNRSLTSIGSRIINSVFQSINETAIMFSVYNAEVSTIDIKNNYIEECGMALKGRTLAGATWGVMKNINFEGNVAFLDTYGITPKNYFIDLSNITSMYVIIDQNYFEDSIIPNLLNLKSDSYGASLFDNLYGNSSINYITGGYSNFVRNRDVVTTPITLNSATIYSPAGKNVDGQGSQGIRLGIYATAGSASVQKNILQIETNPTSGKDRVYMTVTLVGNGGNTPTVYDVVADMTPTTPTITATQRTGLGTMAVTFSLGTSVNGLTPVVATFGAYSSVMVDIIAGGRQHKLYAA